MKGLMQHFRSAMSGRQAHNTPIPPSQRGIVLMTVLVAIMLLSTTVLEFLYASRVKLALAVNQRDELRAYYNAKSGINLIRTALRFQYELEQDELIGQVVSTSNFQLWQYLDLFLPTFVSGQIDSPLGAIDLNDTGAQGFGELSGDIIFHDPVPEEGKLNINNFSGNVIEQEAVLELCALFSPTQYDDLFGQNSNPDMPDRYDRGELIGSIIDYVDSDSDMVIVDENCQLVPSGMGGEERRFRDLSYESKNEPLTTLDEILLVPGMSMEIFEMFRENLTVYQVAHQFYVNLADAQGFMGFLCAHILGGDEYFNMCSAPLFAGQAAFLSLALEGWVTFFSSPYALLDFYLGMSTGQAEDRVADGIARGQMIAFRTVQDFTTVLNLFVQDPMTAAQFASMADPQRAQLFGFLASGGLALTPPNLSINFDEAQISERVSVEMPQVFSIGATGIYGSANRTLRAVVDYAQDGRLLFWRER